MNVRRSWRSRRGMTLVEVMVATIILLVMALAVTESMRNSVVFHQLLGERDDTIRTARVVMSKLKRDLQLAYLTPLDRGNAANSKNPERYQTVFVGFDDNPDKLFFASLNHQRLYLDTRESDQTEITIWCEPSDEGEGYTLYHREAPRIDHEPDRQGTIWPLAYNVRSFSLRYLDQQDAEWKEEWDTRSGDTPYRLPRAVEIGLVLIAPDPQSDDPDDTIDVPFVTRVVLEWAPELPQQAPGLGAGGDSLAARTGTAPAAPAGAQGIFNSVAASNGGYHGFGAQGQPFQGTGMFAGPQQQQQGRNGRRGASNLNRNAPGRRPGVQQTGGRPVGGTQGQARPPAALGGAKR